MVMRIPSDEATELMAIRKALGLTIRKFAERLGQPETRYKNWEYGQSKKVPVEVMASARALLGKRPVISELSPIVTYPVHAMPYAGELPAGQWDQALTGDFEDVEARFYKSNRFCARIVGDSCYPALQRSDFTIWESSNSPPFGRLVIAQRAGDHAATIKQLVWDSELSSPRLKAINPDYDDATSEQWGAIAFLVYVRWTTLLGLETSAYNPDGITTQSLLEIRS